MAFWDYSKAVEEVFGAIDTGIKFFDDFFYTKEERARDDQKRAEDFHKFMKVSDMIAQRIRSRTRAQLVKAVCYPYIGGWLATLPVMVVSVFDPRFRQLLTIMMGWLKLLTPIVAAFGGSYIGYYGVQTIMTTFRSPKEGK